MTVAIARKELGAGELRRGGGGGRWRRADLRALIEARYGVALHERSVGKVLRRLGFIRLSVRPKHPEADEAAQAGFEKGSPSWGGGALPGGARGKPTRN